MSWLLVYIISVFITDFNNLCALLLVRLLVMLLLANMSVSVQLLLMMLPWLVEKVLRSRASRL